MTTAGIGRWTWMVVTAKSSDAVRIRRRARMVPGPDEPIASMHVGSIQAGKERTSSPVAECSSSPPAIRPASRMGVQIFRQNVANDPFGLGVRVGSRIHGQPGDVRAYGAAVFDLEDDRVEHGHA